MKTGITFFLLLIFTCYHSQDLRGLWKNKAVSPGTVDEINLTKFNNGLYTGTSYDTSYGGEFCKFTFIAKFDPDTKVFLAKGDQLIDKTKNHLPVIVSLKYKKIDSTEYLEGYGRIVNEDGSLDYPFRVVYYREVEADKKEEMPKDIPKEASPETPKPAPEKKPTPEDIAQIKEYKEKRDNPVKANLRLKTKKVKIRINDYGRQDNDSISIIYNDQLIAYKIPIDNKNKEYDIELEEGKNNELIIIAHNIGEVPPNTTYVEILADDKVFKYTLFTDLKKNAVIRLKYID